MSVAKFIIARLKSDATKKEVNHGTRFYFMAFRSSFQYSDLAVVVRILKLASRTAGSIDAAAHSYARRNESSLFRFGSAADDTL